MVIALSSLFFLRNYELAPIDQKASVSCDKIVGNGVGEFSDLNSALNSLGNNLSGNVICIKNDKVYGKTVIDSKIADSQNPLTIRSHSSNQANARPKFKDSSTPLANDTMYQAAFWIKNSKNIVVEGIEIAEAPSIGLGINGLKI